MSSCSGDPAIAHSEHSGCSSIFHMLSVALDSVSEDCWAVVSCQNLDILFQSVPIESFALLITETIDRSSI